MYKKDLNINNESKLYIQYYGEDSNITDIIDNIKIGQISEEFNKPIILNDVKILGYKFMLNKDEYDDYSFYISIYNSYSIISLVETTGYDVNDFNIEVTDDDYVYINVVCNRE